jgi:AcrR family transcriptional regulator
MPISEFRLPPGLDGIHVTRDRLMDAAERLMAERGFAAVSVREISAEADTQISAITYHFGSKEQLLDAIFERRSVPMNRERARLMDSCEPTVLGRHPTIRELLFAYSEPVFSLAKQPGGLRFLRLKQHIHVGETELSSRLKKQYIEPGARRFTTLLQLVNPQIPPRSLYLRFNVIVGALFSLVRDVTSIATLSNGAVDIDYDAARDEFIDFLAAGWESGNPSDADRPIVDRGVSALAGAS